MASRCAFLQKAPQSRKTFLMLREGHLGWECPIMVASIGLETLICRNGNGLWSETILSTASSLSMSKLSSAVLERSELLQLRWDLWEVSVLLLAFGVAQFVRVSCLHVMIRLSSAAGLNLALLATDFYAVMAGITFFHYKVRSSVSTIP